MLSISEFDDRSATIQKCKICNKENHRSEVMAGICWKLGYCGKCYRDQGRVRGPIRRL